MRQTITLPIGSNRANVIERIGRYLSVLPKEQAYVVKVEAYKPRRSDQQNRYLWGVVYETILKTGQLDGWHAEDLHEYFLGECFGWETLEGMGRKRMRPLKRSSKLSTNEFSDYVAFIQQRAAEMGVYIPDPGEEFA
jgi:hypothetical protein